MRLAASLLTLAASVLAFAAPVSAAEGRLPIFDTHMHYSRDAWAAYGPEAIVERLDEAGVPRALVSSTPDDGTLALHGADAGRFVPVLRPYRSRADMAGWFRDPEVLAYVSGRLARGIYRGIGEFHLFETEAARTPEIKRLTAMAVERDVFLHVHADSGPVIALFEIEPRLKILWAHAGLSTPPGRVGAALDDHARLWADLAFRAGDIAPGGKLDPVWRALLLRHADRFTIGTDTYLTSRWDVYGALVDEHRRWLAQLPRAVAEAIAYRNAIRLYGAGAVEGLGN